VTSRIKGPGDKPPVDATEAVESADATSEVQPGAPASVKGPEAAQRSGTPDAIGYVAQRLKSGEISVDEAVDILIDDAIERQVGRAVEVARDLAPKLREVLRGYASNDPTLAARIRRLTLVK
jgi:hypothetical protein